MRPAAHLLPIVLVICLGVILSAALFVLVRRNEARSLRAEFSRRADVPNTALQQDIDDYVHLLRSIDDFFWSSQEVDRKEFSGYTKSALSRFPGLHAVQWIPRVTDAGRLAHEQQARLEGFPQYQILDVDEHGRTTAAARRPGYLPVFYVEPPSRRDELGLDLALNADCAATMARASSFGLPAAGTPFTMRAGTNTTVACRVFIPVYTNLVGRDTSGERQSHLAGYAAEVMDVHRLIESTMGRLRDVDLRGIAWRLIDAGAAGAGSEPVLIFQSAAWKELSGPAEISERFSFETAGRHWQLNCQATPAYLAGHRSWQDWAVLLGGLLVTVLAAAYLSATLGRAARVQLLVTQRTAELARSNQSLQAEVDQRGRVEADLAAEREMIHALMDNISDHIYFKDRESRFVRINRSMAISFGVKDPGAAVGRSDADYFTPEHAQNARENEKHILRSGDPLIGREEMETWPDRASTWVSTTKQALRDRKGNIIGTFGISRDITLHKRAERRLAVQYTVAHVLANSATFNDAAPNILQAIGDCLGWAVGEIWRVDAPAGLLRCVELWHARPVEVPRFEAISHSRTFVQGVGLPGRVWKGGEPVWIRDVAQDDNFPRAAVAVSEGLHGAFGFPIRSGTEVLGVIEFFSQRIEQPDEELLRMFAAVGSQIGQFIERQRAEQALALKARELERSNTDLEQFAYVASHDLQEPLRMIASYTQLLERRYHDKLDDEAREFMNFAVDGALRLQTLINDLLAYSRVGTRGKPLAPVDTAQALEHALTNLTVAIEEGGARVERTPLPTVLGDETQLTQLLQNLIGNAIKFRGDKPAVAHVTATLRKSAPASEANAGRPLPNAPAMEWLFAVRDEGIGIEKKYFDRIFIIFQRLHGREEYPGTGIGLAVCKRIVERHGGRIWLESTPGGGSTFFFTLPQMPEADT